MARQSTVCGFRRPRDHARTAQPHEASVGAGVAGGHATCEWRTPFHPNQGGHMHTGRVRLVILGSIVAGPLAAGCGTADTGDVVSDTDIVSMSSGLTAAQRLADCGQDPRVVTGLVSREVCAGADIFFRETFNGNGRNCGTCHPAGNNTTIDVPFIQNLHATNPNDPLFVFETNPALATARGRVQPAPAGRDPRERRRLRGSDQQVRGPLGAARAVDGHQHRGRSRRRESDDPARAADGLGRRRRAGRRLAARIPDRRGHPALHEDLARRPGIDFRLPTAPGAGSGRWPSSSRSDG